jgi:hypothetical protein
MVLSVVTPAEACRFVNPAGVGLPHVTAALRPAAKSTPIT